MSLMCLAMNERLSAAEFREIADLITRNRERLFNQTIECASRLPIEQRVQYLSTVLPLVMAL